MIEIHASAGLKVVVGVLLKKCIVKWLTEVKDGGASNNRRNSFTNARINVCHSWAFACVSYVLVDKHFVFYEN